MGVEDRGREEWREHEGGRGTYEGAWEWRIEGGKSGENMREEGRHDGCMGVEDRGREEWKEHEGGRETYEGA